MVTRFINKNTPFQVNAINVGIELRPDYVLDSIDFDYGYTNYSITNKQNNYQIVADHDDNLYAYNGETVVIEEDTYYRMTAIDSTITHPTVYNQYDEALTSQTLFEYVDGAMTPINTIASVLSLSGDFIKVADDKVSQDFSTYYIISGNVVKSNAQQSLIVGYITSTNEVESEITGAALQDSSTITGKYEFKKNSTSVWADTNYPKVGDPLIFSPIDPTFNVLEVSNVTDHEGALSATLSYSVSANNWTSHQTTLTDRNNVICSVPRYMYLKLDQDCVITEA